jgi:hypothetical protein
MAILHAIWAADTTPTRAQFSGKYEHRMISGGIGHNLPQEAPQAVVDVGGF